jgi:glycosyltransferase involved in cell wall biosynthesis
MFAKGELVEPSTKGSDVPRSEGFVELKTPFQKFLSHSQQHINLKISNISEQESIKRISILGEFMDAKHFKIAVIVPSYSSSSNQGGIDIVTRDLVFQLKKNGHIIDIFTVYPKYPSHIINDNGVTVHYIFGTFIPFIKHLFFIFHAAIAIKKLKVDIIHVQTISILNGGIAAYLCKKLFDIPYVIWGHGSDVFLRAPISNYLDRILVHGANSVVAVSPAMKNKMQSLFKVDAVVIPNGINPNRYNLLSKSNAQAIFHIHESDFILLFIGRLHPVKRVGILIDAMINIHPKNTKIKLHIIGDGPQKKELLLKSQQLVQKDIIIFHGEVPHSKIPEYLNAADIFVLPSISEGFPIVLIEGMASGLPIVATYIPGITNIICNNRNGLLVPPDDPHALESAILYLFDHPEIRIFISDNNINDVKKFRWKQVLQDIEDLYDQIIMQQPKNKKPRA